MSTHKSIRSAEGVLARDCQQTGVSRNAERRTRLLQQTRGRERAGATEKTGRRWQARAGQDETQREEKDAPGARTERNGLEIPNPHLICKPVSRNASAKLKIILFATIIAAIYYTVCV